MGDTVLFLWFVMFLWVMYSVHKDIQNAVEEEEENDGESENNETETNV